MIKIQHLPVQRITEGKKHHFFGYFDKFPWDKSGRLRPITIGRDNWMFLGKKRGGKNMGVLMILVQTCRAMDINALTYLEDVLRRINGHPASHLAELLPGNLKKVESYY